MNLKDRIQLIDRVLRKDDRGWFLKVLTGQEEFLTAKVGEVYMAMAKSGEWRANHFHPKTAEWFTVFKGEATVILEDIENKERISFHLNGAQPKTLFVPAGVAHVFINTSNSEEMILVVYSENGYDPSDTIIYDLLENGI